MRASEFGNLRHPAPVPSQDRGSRQFLGKTRRATAGGGAAAITGGRGRSGAVCGSRFAGFGGIGCGGQQAAAAATAAKKSPQQQLEELQSLYKQGLINESEYNASKQKILNSLSQ